MAPKILNISDFKEFTMASEITVFATQGPVDVPVHGFDSEGNDLGPVGNGWSFIDIVADPPIVLVSDEGHGSLTIDPGPPVGTGDCVVTFNGSAAGGPNRPGSLTVHVLPGEVASLGI